MLQSPQTFLKAALCLFAKITFNLAITSKTEGAWRQICKPEFSLSPKLKAQTRPKPKNCEPVQALDWRQPRCDHMIYLKAFRLGSSGGRSQPASCRRPCTRRTRVRVSRRTPRPCRRRKRRRRCRCRGRGERKSRSDAGTDRWGLVESLKMVYQKFNRWR